MEGVTPAGRQQELFAELRRVAAFASWPDAVMERLAKASSFRRFNQGEFILQMGHPVTGLWFLVEGCVANSRTLPTGDRLIFEFLIPGHLTGLLPVFDEMPAPFDAIAHTDCLLVHIRGENVRQEVLDSKERTRELIKLLCVRTRLDYETIHMRTANTLPVQLAKTLVYLFERLGGLAPRDLPFSISQDDLASMMGISRQSANKELNKLVDDGVVALRYRRIRLVDREKLHVLARAEGRIVPTVEKAITTKPRLNSSDTTTKMA
jgi:CRP-like cAMP-binding protein